jgi:hypothetical protein
MFSILYSTVARKNFWFGRDVETHEEAESLFSILPPAGWVAIEIVEKKPCVICETAAAVVVENCYGCGKPFETPIHPECGAPILCAECDAKENA